MKKQSVRWLQQHHLLVEKCADRSIVLVMQTLQKNPLLIMVMMNISTIPQKALTIIPLPAPRSICCWSSWRLGKVLSNATIRLCFVGSSSLVLESDVHRILPLSSILLLQNNNRIHKAMIPFFCHQLYTKIRKQSLDSWAINIKFPPAAMVNLIEITQDVYNK